MITIDRKMRFTKYLEYSGKTKTKMNILKWLAHETKGVFANTLIKLQMFDKTNIRI